MLVRISKKGMNVLDNRELSKRVISSIIKSKDNFDAGQSVKVDETLSVKTVISPTEHQTKEKE